MATIFYTLVLLIFSNSFLGIYSLGVGINYGQIGNNLPSPSRVSILLGSLNISRVKLYDADPNVLTAFANTNVDFIIGLGNEYLQKMQDPQQAQIWIQQKVQPYIAQTRITCITVGNEVLGGVDPQLPAYLVPAMKAMHQALVNLGLSSQVYVTTAHSLQILKTSFPPSSGAFRDDLIQYIQPILAFHAQSNSPFLINAYPYFAYKSDPKNVQIEYLLFEPNPGSVDPVTNLKYDNMLYAQIDAVYSGMKALGHSDVQVRISETGWPSKGDVDEPGATVQNAGIYNRNLLQRMQQGQGTPAHPSQHIDIYVFALFNENMKPGPTSERNYGLYYPDGTPVYNLGVQGYLPLIDYSSSKKNMADRLTNFTMGSSKIPLKGQSLEGEALCGYTELRARTPSRITRNLTTAPPMIFGLIILFLALEKTYMYSAYQHAFSINLL